MKKGDISDNPIFARSDKVLVATFHDSKRVSLLSTVHKSTTVNKDVRSRRDEGGHRTVKKPECVVNYNKHMGGVDHFDQKSGSYPYPYRCQKWYLPLFHFVVEVALVNSFILYKKSNPNSKLLAKKFRELVCLKLVEAQAADKAQGRQRPATPIPAVPRMNAPHYPSKYDNPKYKPDCVVCKSIGKRSQTRFYCGPCATALCVHPCFGIYHQHMDFKAERQRLQNAETHETPAKRQRTQ